MYLVLQPKKFKYKLLHKNRSQKVSQNSFKLNYGNMGLILVQPLRINSKKLFRLKLFLKKSARKSDKTARKAWLNAFPHLPLTKKPLGSRMGKAKGKLSIWCTQLYVGTVLIEFKNLRIGRVLYYTRQVSFRVKSQLKLFYRHFYQRGLPVSKSKRSTSRSFW